MTCKVGRIPQRPGDDRVADLRIRPATRGSHLSLERGRELWKIRQTTHLRKEHRSTELVHFFTFQIKCIWATLGKDLIHVPTAQFNNTPYAYHVGCSPPKVKPTFFFFFLMNTTERNQTGLQPVRPALKNTLDILFFMRIPGD